jgi:diacylglycerol kinase
MGQIIRTSAEWTAIFQANAGARDFGVETHRLTPDERTAISKSLQEFQLGETGEGSHIMRQAQRQAARDGDREYLVALRLFIAEEIRHSRELKAFMDANGIPVVKRTPADSVFRLVRRLAGLELSIAVLVGAEIVAKVYYLGLARATGSAVLQRTCRQILKDEVDHVHFQTQRLAILRRDLGPVALAARNAVYHVCFRLGLLLLWVKHGRAMRAGRYTFRRYYSHALTELRAAMITMDPRNYAWHDRPKPAGFVASRVTSIRCAMAGVGHLLRMQKNAHLHALATVIVLAVGIALHLAAAEWRWLTVAVALVWTAEAFNTSLEFLCDAACPAQHPLIGKAKDVAAGSVLLAALASIAIAGFTLGPRLFP